MNKEERQANNQQQIFTDGANDIPMQKLKYCPL